MPLTLAACSREVPLVDNIDAPAAEGVWDTVTLGPELARTTLVAGAGYTIGAETAGLGDLDGDGTADLAVVHRGAGDDGFVALYSGATLALGGELGVDAAFARIEGAGVDVALAGDVDGDGLADVLVGDPDTWSLFVGADLAPGARLQPADAFARFASGEGLPLLGAAGGGDIDGDGRSEILVSEYTDASRPYEALRVVRGASLSRGDLVDLTEAFGAYGAVVDGDGPTSRAFIGDFDGDGKDDVASGATRNFAAVQLGSNIDEETGGGLSDQEVHVHTCHPDDASCGDGVTAQGAGDVDGDGTDDLLLSVYPLSTSWVIPGATLAADGYATQLVGGIPAVERAIDGAGPLVGLGDLDGQLSDDGRPFADLLASNGEDTAWVILGNQLSNAQRFDVADAMHILTGFATEQLHIDAPGDLDGDGHPDLLLGAPSEAAGDGQGRIYLLFTPSTPAG